MAATLCPDRERWIYSNAQAVGRVYGETPDDRADFAQEASVAAVLLLRRKADADDPYIVRTMHNHCISILRKRKVRAVVLRTCALVALTDDADDGRKETGDAGSAIADTGPTPYESAVQGAELQAAFAVLDHLPYDQREAFVASAVIGIPEYIRRSGLTKDSAYKRVQRARASIARLLAGDSATDQMLLAL